MLVCIPWYERGTFLIHCALSIPLVTCIARIELSVRYNAIHYESSMYMMRMGIPIHQLDNT